ncbi:unnamed protein product (mitochondrion) [Plasmodiophora brassicae]|uniref:Large ribosomal subunit protein uL2m n=1 Tax=Plasmodiophora brassicae TaxID=37360 RepID=A0A3P3Y6T6_PLABS|nr:unnamed protein product [Plasmodiophora brassicae]
MAAAFAWIRRALSSSASESASQSARLKVLKPLTNAMRGTVLADTSHLWKGRPVRALSVGLRSTGGRNNHGRITVRHRGGGHKRRYRIIDFKRRIVDMEGIVERLEYDPNRTAYIALVRYDAAAEKESRLAYIVAPHGVQAGSPVQASRTQALDIVPGNAMALRHIPLGTEIHNLEVYPGRGAQMVRTAGASCVLLEKDVDAGYAVVRMPSKEERMFRLDCLATVGVVGNAEHKFVKIGKAGRSRWMGRRPHVRGVAMNPVDHPMGGGEGKTSGGRPSVSPTGQLAKGYKTRSPKKSMRLIVRRRDGRLVKKGAGAKSYAVRHAEDLKRKKKRQQKGGKAKAKSKSSA